MAEQNYIPDIQNTASVAQNISAVPVMQLRPIMKSECIPQETEIRNVKLAHAYVPLQKICGTFTPIQALKKGTAFPPLLDVYRWEGREMGGFDDE